MSMEDKKMLRTRIAANVLYRISGGCKILSVNSELYDYVVVVDGFDFGIKIGSSTMTSNESFSAYLNLLETTDYEKDGEKRPIVLMCVNESSEEAHFGFVLGWRFNQPIIYRNVTLRKINKQTWPIFIDNVKTMSTVIRVLSENAIGVVKKIYIDDNGVQGRPHHAKMIYVRRFSNTYKMQQKVISNEKERFERQMFGIPEDEYPSDDLDKDLQNELIGKYQTVRVKSELLLFSSELQELKQETNRCTKHKVTLIYEPSFDQTLMGLLNNVSLPQFQFNLYISSPFDINHFQDSTLTVIKPINEWLKWHSGSNLLLESVCAVEDIVL